MYTRTEKTIDLLLKLINEDTNFVKPVKIYYEDNNLTKSEYIPLLTAIKSYGEGTPLVENLVSKHEQLILNQIKFSSKIDEFLTNFKEDNKKWIQRNIFSLPAFQSIKWHDTVEEILKKLESAMKAIPWLLDEEIVAFLSENLDNLIKESNFVKSKEEALNKISKCVYKEQIEAVLLYGLNPETFNAWFINNLPEQPTILSINNIAAPNNLTILYAPYTFYPEIKTYSSFNYQIDDQDLTVNPWVHRIIDTTNNLDYMSLPHMR